jgi:F5/8 type C domain/Carbohydrate binding domain (family 11)
MRRSTRTLSGGLLAVLVLVCLGMQADRAAAEGQIIDDFEDLTGWSAQASEGTRVWIVQEPGHTGMGMRIGYDLNSGGGWVLVRKTFTLPLPENYAFTFHLKGEGRPNNFEFKLIDASKNVWWRQMRDHSFPPEWQPMVIRKSRIEFAWGPGHGELRQVAAIEFAISAGEGGPGSLWIDDLMFEEREPASQGQIPPTVEASTSLPQHDPPLMLDGSTETVWKSQPVPREQWVQLDFVRNREYGGLVIDWDPEDYAIAYEVRVSNDGQGWTTAYTTATGHGGRDYVYMPDAESRYVRLELRRSSRAQGYGIASLVVKPTSFSASPNGFFAAIAADSPPGTYPKYLHGKQTYWTVIGVNGDDKEALLNEEGMLEVDKGAFSIEPFLYADGNLITWNSVEVSQKLEDGYLPIPSVTWKHDGLALTVTAFAAGQSGSSILYARYRVENQGDRGLPARLYLAIRPFQVNPPWQSLNMNGGVTHIQEMKFDGRVVWVNREKAVVALTTPDRFGATTFEEGSVTDFLQVDQVPLQTQVLDPFGFASGAMRYNLYLQPKEVAEVDLAVPFHEPYATAAAGLRADDPRGFIARQLEDTRRYWQRILNRVTVDLPAKASKLSDTLRTTLAYILINRDGPALRPGSRNYARSWIRDGAITSSALLQSGFTEEVREFIRWYAGLQAADGKIPCCIDRRGPDPVSENDSPGEFIWAIAEYYRFTHDVGFVADMWPHVMKSVDYMVMLRGKRTTDEYRAPDKEAFYGLLPESISHEGYTAHPVHSYWDDFFALRGLKDAAEMAVVVGDDEHAAKYATLRDNFRETLVASIRRTMVKRSIDYIPGSVELGDLDPTSTSIALTPGDELDHLPRGALENTFDRYWQEVQARQNGTAGEAYTAYELRNVAALIRLGQKKRALELVNMIVADERPPAWNEWAEVTWRDPAAPRFIGDMPHTWVGAGFIRALRSLLVYERESDRALVLLAGTPAEWATSAEGITVRRLPTYYGILNLTLKGDDPDTIRLKLSGDLAMPAGKIVVQSPLDRPLRGATVNGRALEDVKEDGIVLDEFPADVVLRY